jgi:hypothetical protein
VLGMQEQALTARDSTVWDIFFPTQHNHKCNDIFVTSEKQTFKVLIVQLHSKVDFCRCNLQEIMVFGENSWYIVSKIIKISGKPCKVCCINLFRGLSCKFFDIIHISQEV